MNLFFLLLIWNLPVSKFRVARFNGTSIPSRPTASVLLVVVNWWKNGGICFNRLSQPPRYVKMEMEEAEKGGAGDRYEKTAWQNECVTFPDPAARAVTRRSAQTASSLHILSD